MGLRTEETPHKSLKNASLEDFYKECTKDGAKRILNVLDLPMGAAELPLVPQFRSRIIVCCYYSHHLIAITVI